MKRDIIEKLALATLLTIYAVGVIAFIAFVVLVGVKIGGVL